MRPVKRLLALGLCAALLTALVCCAGAVEAGATSACVMDYETGRILYEQNDREQRPIASITKIMTGYLACERADEIGLDTELTCSETAAAEEGSSFYLTEGEKLSYRDAIYGAMLPSGNDAAMLLAETISGDKESFAALMNEKARELGMEDSLFGNPNGLVDEGNYSTAHDMCLLGRAAMGNKLFAKVVKTRKYISSTGKETFGHIHIMDQDERCIGIKTGWTSAAGKTLVSCFEDPDTKQRLIICTLNDWEQFGDHIRLADWAFGRYPNRTLCRKGRTMSTLTNSATRETFALQTAKGLRYPLSKGDTRAVQVRLTLPSRTEELAAGDSAGVAAFYLRDRKLGEIPLVCVAEAAQGGETDPEAAQSGAPDAQASAPAEGDAAAQSAPEAPESSASDAQTSAPAEGDPAAQSAQSAPESSAPDAQAPAPAEGADASAPVA